MFEGSVTLNQARAVRCSPKSCGPFTHSWRKGNDNKIRCIPQRIVCARSWFSSFCCRKNWRPFTEITSTFCVWNWKRRKIFFTIFGLGKNVLWFRLRFISWLSCIYLHWASPRASIEERTWTGKPFDAFNWRKMKLTWTVNSKNDNMGKF